MIWVRINKVVSEGEAANMMGVQWVGGLERQDTQIIKDKGRGAGGQVEPLRVFCIGHLDLVSIMLVVILYIMC